ncbi:hypothetical protein BD410DRAFT_793627 [Rickenella mellea]|uniref:Uncharacterized protein n=1 Tax=Rickenella mellea TaxID=50990 RepID=A0A4Y7PSI1_9AGAM|nr:hypothetical protein BD410DRAFT_793627 [Rickenella mellea]
MAIQAPAKIQILAPEILSEIFQYCFPEDDYRRSTRRLDHAPLLLGRVCSRWRTVSLSTPDLWCNFSIGQYPPVFVADCRKDLDATRVLIARSASRPLSIFIQYDRNYSGRDLLPEIFDMIVSQSWRWKEIDMTVPIDFANILLAPFHAGTLPQLVNFDSVILGEGSASGHSIHLSSAPRLQRFHHDTYAEGVHIDFGGPIHVIRSVDVILFDNPRVSLSDLFTCLTHCPLLTKLDITIAESSRNSLPRELPPTIQLSHLRELSLWLFVGVDPCHLFDRLFLSALISLDLQMHVDDDDDTYTDWPHLKSMLSNSRPPLQTLLLHCVPISEATLIECLSYTPCLISFTIGEMKCTDTTLERLTMDNTDTSRSFCPCLEEVEFGSESSFSELAMIAMILSRRSSANPTGTTTGNSLQFVNCGPSVTRSIRSNPDIAKCLEAGLKLNPY